VRKEMKRQANKHFQAIWLQQKDLHYEDEKLNNYT